MGVHSLCSIRNGLVSIDTKQLEKNTLSDYIWIQLGPVVYYTEINHYFFAAITLYSFVLHSGELPYVWQCISTRYDLDTGMSVMWLPT